MSLKKILAVVMSSAMAIGTFAASALTLDVAESANETVVAEEAALAAEEATVSVWDGVTATTEWYDANPTATEFYLNSASDLAGLAKIVNNNTRTDWHPFYKTTIYLTTDIDLNEKEWTPIGTALADKTGFYGNFDGQNHTISNLWISNWANERAGLFGYTHVDAEGPHQQFKNFTLNNATVVSSKNYVAAIAGSAFVADFENVHLTGDITIQGNGYVGGIIGHCYGSMNNCTVVGTGTINSTFWSCGSLIGYLGEGATGTNCKVIGTGDNGIELWSAMAGIGGAFGMPQTGCTFDKITVSNVTLNTNASYKSYGIGYIAGDYKINPETAVTNSVTNNVTAYTSGTEYTPHDASVTTKAVASVDGELYGDITEALAAIKDNSNVVIFEGEYDAALNISKANVTVKGVGEVTLNGE